MPLILVGGIIKIPYYSTFQHSYENINRKKLKLKQKVKLTFKVIAMKKDTTHTFEVGHP